MAEEQLGQERSEQPTAKRLTEARKKGQLLARESNTLLVMLACTSPMAYEWTCDFRHYNHYSEARVQETWKQPNLFPPI